MVTTLREIISQRIQANPQGHAKKRVIRVAAGKGISMRIEEVGTPDCREHASCQPHRVARAIPALRGLEQENHHFETRPGSMN